jgi:DNA-directed RNA polymerase subunit RPC12/RpoP
MRLIDADKLRQDVLDFPNCYNGFSDAYDKARIIDAIDEQPTIEERKKGKWTEKEVIYKEEADEVIEEWQSAKCSKCGRYHTTPYLYYFKSYNYCPHCGARMEESDETH